MRCDSRTNSKDATAKSEALPRSFGQRGFSLIELLVVVVVMTVIMGAVFKSINVTQQKSVSEAVKLDLTQQGREFMDQITRDLRSAGYPNSRNVSSTTVDSNGNPLIDPRSSENGVGLIKVDYRTLWFAGNVDGSANADGTTPVKIIKYDYVAAGENCPCLRRTEYLRTAYSDPVQDAQNTAAVAQLEIQGVQNGTSFADPIFTAYDPSVVPAVPITVPLDFTANGAQIATVNSMRVVLVLRSPRPDSRNSYPTTRVVSTIGLSNCSEAWPGVTLSC